MDVMLSYLSTAWISFIELDGYNANLGNFLSDEFGKQMCHSDLVILEEEGE